MKCGIPAHLVEEYFNHQPLAPPESHPAWLPSHPTINDISLTAQITEEEVFCQLWNVFRLPPAWAPTISHISSGGNCPRSAYS